MLTYPAISPVAFSLGPLKVHWYGLMYLLGFILALVLGRWRIKHYRLNWSYEELDDLIFYSALGVILGGRLGYMLFYDLPVFLASPWSLFKIWDGGMSFHGGLLGVMIAILFFSKQIKKPFLASTDFAATLVPLGLAAGRVGNFINGELYGRVSDLPWAMVFPAGGPLPRHPSQIYELLLEGLLLFTLVWIYARKPRPRGCVSAIFLIGYASCRILAECFREPDVQFGFIAFDWLTMGQLLSLPMLGAGLVLWWMKRCKPI